MIINHNMQAMNAHRNIGVNQANSQKSMERLSSGLRINRAGDDAAGLSISEKMRGQIKGLNQASRNSQDGISLIQTAEGALDESHAILQRMRELTTQAANDTNVEADRNAIGEEINQLTKELDRITETTEFNTQNLLGGGFSGQLQIGANAGQTIDISIKGMSSADLGLNGGVELNTEVDVNNADQLVEGKYTVKDGELFDSKNQKVGTITNDGNGAASIELIGGDTIDLTNELNDGDTITISNSDSTAGTANVDVTLAKTATGDKLAAGEYTISGDNLLKDGKVIGTAAVAGVVDGKFTLEDGTAIDLVADYGMSKTNVEDGDTFVIKGLDISDSNKASSSIQTLDHAIEKVSKQRSELGAIQSRLEHTIKNLDNASENTQAAESRIRDVDMAKEMMEMTKNNILQQAAQSMLGQANQNPQQVLQLLR